MRPPGAVPAGVDSRFKMAQKKMGSRPSTTMMARSGPISSSSSRPHRRRRRAGVPSYFDRCVHQEWYLRQQPRLPPPRHRTVIDGHAGDRPSAAVEMGIRAWRAGIPTDRRINWRHADRHPSVHRCIGATLLVLEAHSHVVRGCPVLAARGRPTSMPAPRTSARL